MCRMLEEMREETAETTKIESALNLIKLEKLSIEEIATAVNLSVEKVKSLIVSKTALP